MVPANSPERRHRRLFIVGLIVIILLALALAYVTIRFTLTNQEQTRTAESQASRIASLEQEIAAQKGQLEEKSRAIEEQQSQIGSQQSQIGSQQSRIDTQQSEIDAQKSKIDDLNKQLMSKRAAEAASGTGPSVVTTAPATTQKPVVVPAGKLIALTFDDGPGPYTAQLLDAMKERGIHATFFLIGKNIDKYPSVVKRMEAEGHTVGNHTQSHKNLKKLSAAQVKTEIDTCSAKIEKLIGHKPTVMRCPGGNCNSTVSAYAASVGMPILYWSVDTRDWESRNVNSIMTTAFQKSKYGICENAIVLMHDIYGTSVTAAIQMMDKLQAQGYTMVTIPELLEKRYGTPTPGKVYYNAF